MTVIASSAKQTICIDFDGTIVEEAQYPAIGQIKPGAKDVITELYNAGYEIVIYSCRNNPMISRQVERFNQMVDFLSREGIPFHRICLDPKPVAVFYIDDRAIRFSSWAKAREALLK